MASVYSKNLQIYNAEQFKASIDSSEAPHVYLTFGKVSPWNNDASPDQANTSVVSSYEVWKNMMGAKKIVGNNVKLGIRRNDWSSNTVYAAYNDFMDSKFMNDANIKHYVVTSEWNVYKCLANNYGSNSTVMPTSTSTTSAIETADKYIWKYMYTLNDEERLRFVTDTHIPVRTLTEDNGSSQWQVQDNAIPGGIEAILVTTAGTGYNPASPPSITITGDGTGATAVATVNASTTAIDTISITNKGTDYTYANVSISGTGGAAARALISPFGGHGSNPVEELGGSYVIINVRLENTESNVLDVENEFRQVALVKNPYLLATSNVATNTVYSQMTTLTMDILGSSNFVEDEVVYQGPDVATATFKGTVVSWNPTTYTLKLTNTFGNPTTSILYGDTSKAARSINTITYPALEPYSGSVLYIENVAPIQRASDQTEDFKIVISF